MDNEKVVILPNQEEMLGRLLKVDDNSHLQERFYPLLTKHAGEKKVAAGVALMIELAIYDYTANMPPIMSMLIRMKLPNFVDALVSDPNIAEDAKAILATS